MRPTLALDLAPLAIPRAEVRPLEPEGQVRRPSFEEVYDAQFDFVWRSLRQMGVSEHDADDAVQDVFVVVHRKLPAFEPRATIKTWLFSIVLRVAQDHRRSARRKERSGARAGATPDPDTFASGPGT